MKSLERQEQLIRSLRYPPREWEACRDVMNLAADELQALYVMSNKLLVAIKECRGLVDASGGIRRSDDTQEIEGTGATEASERQQLRVIG
jgi:hypothetical protein